MIYYGQMAKLVSYCRVEILGTIVGEPYFFERPNGSYGCRLTILTFRDSRNDITKELESIPNYIHVYLWDKFAQEYWKRVGHGTKVFIVGDLRSSKINNGALKYFTPKIDVKDFFIVRRGYDQNYDETVNDDNIRTYKNNDQL